MKNIMLMGTACLFLSACTGAGPGAVVNDIWSTASGSLGPVNDLVEFGKQVQGDIETTVDDMQERIEKVQSGVNLLMEGKDMIQESLE